MAFKANHITSTLAMQIILLLSSVGIFMLARYLQECQPWLTAVGNSPEGFGRKQGMPTVKVFDDFSPLKTILLKTREESPTLSIVFHKIAGHEKRHTTTTMNKNFGLTKSEFNRLLLELNNGDESLFEQVFLTHFDDCCKFLISTYKASSEDAYDASMNTMLEFCKRLKTGQVAYGNLRFLFTRMAGQIYLKWIKRQKKITGLEGIDIPEPPEEIDDKSYAILNKAWDSLLKDCQTLLEGFYYTGATLEDIASVLNKSAVAVRKQKQRCVDKLRELFMNISLSEI